MRAWIITQDMLDGEDVGTAGPRNMSDEMYRALQAGKGYAFTMYDDDGEAYYKGRAMWDADDEDEGCYGPLGDFGAPNAGCTSIKYHGHPEFDCS